MSHAGPVSPLPWADLTLLMCGLRFQEQGQAGSGGSGGSAVRECRMVSVFAKTNHTATPDSKHLQWEEKSGVPGLFLTQLPLGSTLS